MGKCKYCQADAGFLRRAHKTCEQEYQQGLVAIAGLAERAALVTDPVRLEELSQEIRDAAGQARVGNELVQQALGKSWRQAINKAMSDNLMTPDEAATLVQFRDSMRLNTADKTVREGQDALRQAVNQRLERDLSRAALFENEAAQSARLQELDQEIAAERHLGGSQRQAILGEGYKKAVSGILEDHLVTAEETAALERYTRAFGISEYSKELYPATRNLENAVLMRDLEAGIVNDQRDIHPGLPFNLQKSEKLVFVASGVEYHEVRTRRERRGSSHGASIRVAKGLYYRPGVYKSSVRSWDETVHVATGDLGLTDKHLYFSGYGAKGFRIRYSRIVTIDPDGDGFTVFRDVQNAKPQTFRTGDGWFSYNIIDLLASRAG